MYSALELSKYITSKCIEDGHPISNHQLQHILYLIQQDYLSRGNMAFSDDIEAWKSGPVIPNVYYHFCAYGAFPIHTPEEGELISPKDAVNIDRIVESKRTLEPWELVKETQMDAGAWAQTFGNGEGNHRIIPVDLIRMGR